MIDGIVEWLPSILQFAGGVIFGAFIAGRYFGSYAKDMEAIKESLAGHLKGHDSLCERQKEVIIAVSPVRLLQGFADAQYLVAGEQAGNMQQHGALPESRGAPMVLITIGAVKP